MQKQFRYFEILKRQIKIYMVHLHVLGVISHNLNIGRRDLPNIRIFFFKSLSSLHTYISLVRLGYNTTHTLFNTRYTLGYCLVYLVKKQKGS